MNEKEIEILKQQIVGDGLRPTQLIALSKLIDKLLFYKNIADHCTCQYEDTDYFNH